MGWETRGGRPYYYRKVRRGGRVVSEYCGPGLVGELAELNDEDDRTERHDRIAETRKAAEDVGRVDRQVEGVCNVLAAAARGAMAAAGFHDHKGTWRRRRMPLPAPYLMRHRGEGEIKNLADKANDGDRKALRELKNRLADDPARFAEVGGGDGAAIALSFLARTMALGRDDEPCRVTWEATEAKAALLRDELLGARPSAVERLLVDRIVICWVEVHWLDTLVSVLHAGRKSEAYIAVYDRRRDRAHRRYLQSLRALAAVRRVDLAAVAHVEVNIANVIPLPPHPVPLP